MFRNITLVLSILISINSFTQEIPFKIIGGDIEWSKVYDKELNIEPQQVSFKQAKKNKGGLYIQTATTAELMVDRKDGRTRLRLRNFRYHSPPLTTSEELIGSVAINGKGEFRKSFIKRDSKVLNDMILQVIDEILSANDDDW